MEKSKRIPILVVAATILFVALIALANVGKTDDSSFPPRRLQGVADLKDPRTIEMKSEGRVLEGELNPVALDEANDSVTTSVSNESETKPKEPANPEKATKPEEEAQSDEAESGEPANPKAAAKPEEATKSEEKAQSDESPSSMPFNLPKSAETWCSPPTEQPLSYDFCKSEKYASTRDIVNSVPIMGGLTNSLKILLLAGILSYEEGRCFYVDEHGSALPFRNDPKNQLPTTFLNRYFEQIGLKENDPLVVEAKKKNNVNEVDWEKSMDWHHNRRVMSQTDSIPALGFENVPGHGLKRHIMKRMWRPLPHVREQTCQKLENHVGPDEYMAFSVRRGDKGSVEHFEYATVEQYVRQAEIASEKYFDNKIPTIFVATDDCTIMPEFREKRPNWKFVSECDKESKDNDGFRLGDMKEWTLEQTDAHYSKFFVELYALAASKYFIGVSYTNVTWWVLFMRSQPMETFQILKSGGLGDKLEGVEMW